MDAARTDPLHAYRAKRRAGRTPEPFGGEAVAGGSVFVVQKHRARALHWDLRLELDGVLLSWAVPKGPSPDQADKRLAVRTEDHPLEYAEFEGVIPEGEYGAGAMIVWDRGVWVPLEDPRTGLETGKLLFELRGYKLRGAWTLVKTRQSERSWLLIKERDAHMTPGGGTEDYPDDSVYSGLTVEEFARAEEIADALAERLHALGAPRRPMDARDVKPMLATARAEPFDDDDWHFELKYDGYRVLAGRREREARLWSRNGQDLTSTFPEVARAVRGLPYEGLILDGEVVVHDEAGLPSFSLLQRRGRVRRRIDALRAALETPATLYVFDLLAAEGHDVRRLPLHRRREILRELLPTVGPLRFSDHVAGRGTALYRQVQAMGLEGIVGKRADSPYRGGRSRAWVKIRTVHVEDFAIVGWKERADAPGEPGSLHLAQVDGEGLRYMGSVGSGLTARMRRRLAPLLEGSAAGACPCADGPVPAGDAHHWVRPHLVAEVRYKEVTPDGLLRHPSLVRVRDDKPVEECRVRPALARATGADPDPPPPAGGGDRSVAFSNLDKVFWPADGTTKGDLLEYHRRVARWMLPYLADRPLVMTRYPDGIDGKSFYQKDAPPYAPEWIRRVTVWSESSQRELSYFVVDSEEALLYVINLGTIPIHIWSSRVSTLATPDWCILDLDPKEAPFADVVTLARLIRALGEEIGLPTFAKTSGSSGIHVLIPLGGRLTHAQSRSLAELLARVVVAERGDIATLTRNPERRQGKVYVDYLQNGHGQLIAAPFTVRPLPGAPVSTPLKWTEVTRRLRIGAHTIHTVPRRMKRLGADPMEPLLHLEPDLLGALERLRHWFD